MFRKRFSLLSKRETGNDESIGEVSGSGSVITSFKSGSPASSLSSATSAAIQSLGDRKHIKPAVGPLDRHGPAWNPIGLKLLHRPLGERKIDVIFVHGLGGNSRATWCKDGDPDLFWPLTFLSLEPGMEGARIMTFGYNAHFRPGVGKKMTSILDFAKELLFDMRYGRDEIEQGEKQLDLGTAPIVFVAHSMGGLVVKEAYMLGQSDPAYQPIAQSMSGILFLFNPPPWSQPRRSTQPDFAGLLRVEPKEVHLRAFDGLPHAPKAQRAVQARSSEPRYHFAVRNAPHGDDERSKSCENDGSREGLLCSGVPRRDIKTS